MELITIDLINKHLDEYIKETGRNIALKEFVIDILGYGEKEYESLIHPVETEKKQSGESKKMNRRPHGLDECGDRENPEYEKYRNMVVSFREYMCNKKLRPENGEKKTMVTFMKYAYNLEGDDALREMRKIESIVYAGRVSYKEKRNKRREKREQMFNEKLGI